MKQKIAVTRYEVNTTAHACLRGSLRIALVADLHERSPWPVLALLEQERPDLILVAGDLMERREEGMSEWTRGRMEAWQGIGRRSRVQSGIVHALDYAFGGFRDIGGRKKWNIENGRIFLREASAIAPVYMGVGNHEWYFLPEDLALMRESGVTLLDNADAIVRTRVGRILVGGLSTRYDMEWLGRYSGKEGFKILVCHHPEYYLRHIKDTAYDSFDLIVSGHCHGGQWRIRGHSVFAPGQGLFPKYAYGMFDTHGPSVGRGADSASVGGSVLGKAAWPESDSARKLEGTGGKLIVSGGCANTASVPRWGNPCELVMADVRFGAGANVFAQRHT